MSFGTSSKPIRRPIVSETPLQNDENALQNAPCASDLQGDAKRAEG